MVWGFGSKKKKKNWGFGSKKKKKGKKKKGLPLNVIRCNDENFSASLTKKEKKECEEILKDNEKKLKVIKRERAKIRKFGKNELSGKDVDYKGAEGYGALTADMKKKKNKKKDGKKKFQEVMLKF